MRIVSTIALKWRFTHYGVLLVNELKVVVDVLLLDLARLVDIPADLDAYHELFLAEEGAAGQLEVAQAPVEDLK